MHVGEEASCLSACLWAWRVVIAGGRSRRCGVFPQTPYFFSSVPFAFFSPAKQDLGWIMMMNYEDNEILTWQKSDGLFLYGYGASCTRYLRPGGWQYCRWSTSDSWRLSTSQDSMFLLFLLVQVLSKCLFRT